MDLFGQNWRLADQYPNHEGTQHRVHANQFRCQRCQTHEDENGREHGEIDAQIIIGPPNDVGHHSPAEGKAQREKKQRTADGETDAL